MDHSSYQHHLKFLNNNFIDEEKLSPVSKHRYPLNETSTSNKYTSGRHLSPPSTHQSIPSYQAKLVNNMQKFNYDDSRHKVKSLYLLI